MRLRLRLCVRVRVCVDDLRDAGREAAHHRLGEARVEQHRRGANIGPLAGLGARLDARLGLLEAERGDGARGGDGHEQRGRRRV
jgi:hypothetical protein